MRHFMLLSLLAIGLLACSQVDILPENPAKDTPLTAMVDCDTCLYPIVMVHGFLASGDTWTKFQQLFHSNGYNRKTFYRTVA